MILENILFYSRYVQLGSVNYPFNRLFHPVEMGDLFQKAHSENLQKRVKNNKENFPLLFFPAIMTLACVHVFYPLGRIASSLSKFFVLGETFPLIL